MNSKDSLFSLTESEVPCESSCECARWGKVVGLPDALREFKTPTQLPVILDSCLAAHFLVYWQDYFLAHFEC